MRSEQGQGESRPRAVQGLQRPGRLSQLQEAASSLTYFLLTDRPLSRHTQKESSTP